MFTTASTTSDKLLQMVAAILLFAAIIGLILFIASRFTGKSDRAVAALYLAPVVVMLSVGLLYPGLRTVYQSFLDASLQNFVGFDNYQRIIEDPEQRLVLRNTFFWVLVTPFAATGIGLLYAILVDKARGEAFAKALIFLPMSISGVAATVIWKFMYEYRPDQSNIKQIGVINQIIVLFGGKPQQLLIDSPLNTFLLIAIMIWIQAGFAMTVLSAAIKAIPDDIVEAARLDGVTPWGMFRFVTVPAIRPALVVVLTTIAIGTLKVFDIVQTMTGGRFDTSVIANEFYSQAIRTGDRGFGAALAVVLFVLVIPIVVYNIRQLRRSEA